MIEQPSWEIPVRTKRVSTVHRDDIYVGDIHIGEVWYTSLTTDVRWELSYSDPVCMGTMDAEHMSGESETYEDAVRELLRIVRERMGPEVLRRPPDTPDGARLVNEEGEHIGTVEVASPSDGPDVVLFHGVVGGGNLTKDDPVLTRKG